MTRKRNVRSASEKAKVALAAVKELHTISELASQFGVHPTQVHQWKRRLLDGAETLFQGPVEDRRQEQQELTELYEQIGRLKMELEWLKKKAAHFG
jgi:transposase-like protein